ncbi:type III polyketide synthase [Micromonospora rifamycinica]|uniref:3,5-dihydroxyphenylacetyl-CoA synthase DpgA n=1 Tax=Micromonospora rifamycinica TaxID=291594 RepID=UPI002E2A94E9|nr:3,5-dihydroxyphenylacetyl-CoA synthase DpgA [Micromonospora rifamycinica]
MSTSAEGPSLLSVGTAVSPDSYTQEEVLDLYGITDARIRSVFYNSGIDRRHLAVVRDPDTGRPVPETQGQLLAKHRTVGLEMAEQAITMALKRAGVALADVAHLCCVTSTGFLTPGFSAMLIKQLGLAHSTSRLDVVGMGCNAGANALQATSAWASTHPGQLAILVCVEVCSAAYVIDDTMRTAVVNSLFGDGSAALVIRAPVPGEPPAASVCPRVVGSASTIVPEAIEAMRFDWDDVQGRFSFFLDRDVPYVVGAHVEETIDRLLAPAGLRRTDVAHWTVHSGGRKVIDSVQVNLGLTRHDLRHTLDVLRDLGNLSSGSFLFSYERLLAEQIAAPGDYGVLMAMGPGSSIEAVLTCW